MVREPLAPALRLTAGVWMVLAGAALLRPALGNAAGLLGMAGGCLLVFGRSLPPRRRPAPAPPLLAGVAGFASLPAWLALLVPLGMGLGLVPLGELPPAPGVLGTLGDVAIGPLLEEGLYRARLLPALRAALGTALALALSSALFALPHGDPWLVLAAFLLGLALGGAFLATRSLAVCTAYHGGLNLAVTEWLRGRMPPLAPATAGLISALLLGAAAWRARRRRAHA